MNCDVLIVGAGTAGIAAAVAAAESGLQVVLIEKYGFVGGLATSAMVGTICGLYYRSADKPRYAVRGFARTFTEKLAQRCGSKAFSYAEGLHFLPYQPYALHQQAVQDLQDADVKLLLHMFVADVIIKHERIHQLRIITADTKFTLHPHAVVDCSGDAQISMLAGLEMLKQNVYQSAAFVFQVAGFPQMEPHMLALNLIRWIKRGIHGGHLHAACERLSIVPGTLNNGVALLKLGLPPVVSSKPMLHTQFELQARTRSNEIINYLRTEEILKSLTITAMAPQVGIRTSQRPFGIELLEEKQLLACAKPSDGVAIGAWPIEHWGEKPQPQMSYFKENDHYLVPAGTLVSKDIANLFFAGRAFSASEPAIASARVIGTCLSTGYAAGKLAASFVTTGDWQCGIEIIRNQQVTSAEI
jgi:FAD dependent oxidoreductase